MIRGVQNICLTRQPARPALDLPVPCGSLSQVVWIGRVRFPKLWIGLGYGLKNCQPATIQHARLIIHKKKLVQIVKYLKLINSPNKFLQLIFKTSQQGNPKHLYLTPIPFTSAVSTIYTLRLQVSLFLLTFHFWLSPSTTVFPLLFLL